MFYELSDKQKVFIEMTNIVHGGEGWEFGVCLWSPEKSKDDKHTWEVMREVKEGDLIIHSVKTSNGHKFIGASIANSECGITNIEPSDAGRWSGHENYYRIELREFKKFEHQLAMKDFLNKYRNDLVGIEKSFFTSDYKPAQKYLINISGKVFKHLNEDFSNNNIKYYDKKHTSIVNKITSNNGNNNPERKDSIVKRIVRDTKIIKYLKVKYEDKCQICGRSILLPNEKKYSEGHHLKRLGGTHCGPDTKDNVIILCPYHHTEFDYGSIAINPMDNKIIHIDKNNEYYGQKLNYQRTDLNKEFISYHYKNIYKKKF